MVCKSIERSSLLNSGFHLYIHYRVVHVFAQKHNGECQWFTYKIEKGRNNQWDEKGTFPECSGYKIGKKKCLLH